MSLSIYLFGVFAVVLVMLSSYFLGEQSKGPGKAIPYESGIVQTGSSRMRFFSQYFMVAILFVIFDLESVFLYLWASSLRDVGWIGFIQIAFFVFMLLLSLAIALSMGILNISPRSAKERGNRFEQ